jgi:hypothetical protein
MRILVLALMLAAAAETPVVNFIDIAAQSGLTVANTLSESAHLRKASIAQQAQRALRDLGIG